MSASYTGLKSSLNKKTNFLFHTDYDAIRWTNFYGLGNESKLDTDDIWYYRWATELGFDVGKEPSLATRKLME